MNELTQKEHQFLEVRYRIKGTEAEFSPPYLWILQPQIQPTTDQKIALFQKFDNWGEVKNNFLKDINLHYVVQIIQNLNNKKYIFKKYVVADMYYVVRLMTVASVLNMYRPFFSSHHSLPGVSILRPMGHMRPRMTMNEAQHKINLFKTFFAHQFSLVFVYLMCGQRQLFFFQCGQRRQKVGHPSYVAFTLY